LVAEDVTPPALLTSEKKVLIGEAYRKCDTYIGEYKRGSIVCQPGQTSEETLESKMRGDLNAVRCCVCTACKRFCSLMPGVVGTRGSR